MNLSIEHSTFHRNLKFWGFHTLINSIPSMCLAYLHDWDTMESIIAMCIGITLFALMLAFFMSMKDINEFCTKGIMERAIRAGTYLRLALFIIAIPGILSFMTYYYGGYESLEIFANITGLFWAPDFVTGIISHGFYQSLRGVIPITGVHNFIPTVIITILQGIFLMGMLIAAGILLAALGLGAKKKSQPISTQAATE